MLIENPEQFKAWLTSVLEPLCDAEPSALAKYVYALVKKDKTLDELRVGMVEQLDVFLQQETHNFVELLFKTLESKEYIKAGNPIKLESEDNKMSPSTTNAELSVQETTVNPVAPNSPNSLHINGTVPPITLKRDFKKSESEKEEKEKRPRSRTGRAVSRTRSRSRSWERDRRRSRSRDHIRRDRERDRSRPWRNKSPPQRRHDRRRSRSRSISPIRSRLRDGPEHRSRYRNRSPTPIHSRSRSRSLDRKKIERFDRLERLDSPGGGTPTQDSNHGDVDMRLSTTSQSIQSVVSAAPNLQSSQFKRRCRDFDEKGYCMRGDLCPYDHGTDPVVLEDVNLSRVLTFGPQGPGTVPVGNVPEPPPGSNGTVPPPHLPLATLPPPHLRNQHHSNMEYNPDAPSMEPQVPWNRHPPPPGPPMYGRGQRELISVPVATHANPTDAAVGPNNPLKRKQAFDFNRLGPKQRASHNPTNCSLELKKVPRSLNNITQLNNHFSKFGKIVNIQVSFGGDPEAALVTFQQPSEAKAAYRSTEAVLNNRFIKVFWHNSNNNANNNTPANTIENVPPAATRQSVKERLGATVSSPKKEENEYVPTRRPTEELQQAQQPQAENKPVIPVAPKPPAPSREEKVLAIKKTQEILAAKESIKKKVEEKRKEALKISSDLRKRKQDLLEKQLSEMKMLIEKIEKHPEQKDVIMASVKHLQQSIESIRKDLATNNGQTNTSKNQLKTREQAQKEILDAELDLITAQQEGQDSLELQKRLNELKAQAASLDLSTTTTPAGRGTNRVTRVARGALTTFRGRGRGSTTYTHVASHASVDHRPTSLLVSGYETEEKAEVLAHFQQYGEIVNQIVDDTTPSIVINYKSRKEAEVAMLKGRNFQDRTLSITWVSGHHLHRGGGASKTNAAPKTSLVAPADDIPPITDEEIDLENVEDLEALLLDENEEEEDEDGESRSWRR